MVISPAVDFYYLAYAFFFYFSAGFRNHLEYQSATSYRFTIPIATIGCLIFNPEIVLGKYSKNDVIYI